MAKLLPGKPVAEALNAKAREEIARLKKRGVAPKLAIVRCGEDASRLAYEKGEGVEQSYEQAMEYYQLAAGQGAASAQYSVGSLYYNGHGVEQSYEEALKWFESAAEQGSANAQYALGLMHENGEGVEQSFEKAAGYYGQAAGQDDGVRVGAGRVLQEHVRGNPDVVRAGDDGAGDAGEHGHDAAAVEDVGGAERFDLLEAFGEDDDCLFHEKTPVMRGSKKENFII